MSLSDTLAIETLGLRKEYGKRVVLPGLDLAVRPGEVFGFLGPNGAGKSTTIKILIGLVHPTSGEARIFGQPAGSLAARRRIGYLPENFRFHDWLTGRELLDFHGRLAGISSGDRQRRIPEVLALVGLADRGNDRVRGYSKGMTQRIGLAQALLHRPDLILLDEPTSALDPIGRREVREIIRTLQAEGITVFLNSHLLGEVEMVCDRIAIVDRGRVVWSGDLNDLHEGRTVRVTVDETDEPLLCQFAEVGKIIGQNGTTIDIAVTDGDAAPRLAAIVVRSGRQLHELTTVQRSLEDAFVQLVSGSSG